MVGRNCMGGGAAVALALVSCLSARADEADAKTRFKAMSDYMAQQSAISFALRR